MAFLLFLLVNAALFIRPGEIVPDWQGLEIYFYLIVACLICGLPDVIQYLTDRPIDTKPVTLCVIGLLVCVALAPLVMLDIPEAWRTGFVFFKVVVYFVLLVSLVRTPARMRTFLSCLVVCCSALTLLTVLKYHGFIELSTLDASLRDSMTNAWGQVDYIQRLQGSGIFQDPNDLCMMLAAAVPLSLFLLATSRNTILSAFWLVSLLLFCYAIYLTRSRGGLLAMMGGLGVCCWARFGLQRTLLISCIGLPALLLIYGGRQTSISTDTNTGQTRIQLWSDWMMEFRANLPFGRGMALPKEEDVQRVKITGEKMMGKHLAHNAYIQAFADMGVLGGCLFIGAFGLVWWSVYRLGRSGDVIVEPAQRQLQPYMLASITAYSVGMLTLSIPYIVPTYLILGLGVAYERATTCWPAPPPMRLDAKLMSRLAVAGACFLGVIYLFIRLFINWG